MMGLCIKFFLHILFPLLLITSAHSSSLENLSDGKFRGSGFIRTEPDKPLEKFSCRLEKKPSKNVEQLEFSGKCATATLKGRVKFKIDVIEPKKRYRLEVRIFGDGRLEAHVYEGMDIGGKRVRFTSGIEFNGEKYASVINVDYSRNHIHKISEIVTSNASGKSFKMFELITKVE
ncbi:MAG: hypothetical protein AAF478_03780 [Pseudomonadota bacterium]